ALVLAPEAYLPLRKLGANYHASAEGMAAAEQVFALLEAPRMKRGTRREVPDMRRANIEVEGLTVAYEGRAEPALEQVSLDVEAGEVLALAGPSGCGKSTLLSVLLGFIAPQHGSVRVGDAELAELVPGLWRAQIAWVPQRPHLFAASIAENVRIGRRDALDKEIESACDAVGLASLLSRLPDGIETRLGDRGIGLSGGERQRVALARALVRDAPLLLLDEPTASLDGETEAEVLEAVQRLLAGRTAIVVAHRQALLEMADRVVTLGAAEMPATAGGMRGTVEALL
ncbi:MAG TPA: ATP-binding cassette domain-containing protein, partial [Solirubrobacteraceae bacterium]|nr:ATP-binding cassette domain-containing protein [Solirubrobacteraceae bacterium]